MKTSLTIAIFLTVIGITSAYTLEEIATQSKKANDFRETLGRNAFTPPGGRIVLWNQDALR